MQSKLIYLILIIYSSPPTNS